MLPICPRTPRRGDFFFFNEFATLSRQTDMGIPDHLTCLLKTLYAGQEATVRTMYSTTDWFNIEKGV